MSTIKTCRILGVNIAVTNMAQTVQYIEENLDELRGKYICVSNVHTTVMAHDNPAYRNVQNSAAIALPVDWGLNLQKYFQEKAMICLS